MINVKVKIEIKNPEMTLEDYIKFIKEQYNLLFDKTDKYESVNLEEFKRNYFGNF